MIEEVTDADRGGDWFIHVDEDMRLTELAALIAGIGAGVTVEFIEKGSAGRRGAVIRPIYIGAPKPTALQIRDILEHGVQHLPMLRIVGRMW